MTAQPVALDEQRRGAIDLRVEPAVPPPRIGLAQRRRTFARDGAPDLLSPSLMLNILGDAWYEPGSDQQREPDWAGVRIAYRGARIDRAGLLRYLVSFRDHAEFHEQCVERIFVDVMARCRPQTLSVEARYTRRGGLDINPWRATPGWPAPTPRRDLRQ